MKKLLLLLSLFVSHYIMFSQSIFKSYDLGGDDYGNNISVNNKGSYICGSTNSGSAGAYDAMLTHFDINGNFVWEKTFGGANGEIGRALTPFGDGFIVAGTTQSASVSHKSDIVISYVDTVSGYQGSKVFGFDSLDEYANDVVVLPDGGLLITGQTKANSDNNNRWKMFVIRTDHEANPLWMRTYGFPFSNEVGQRLFVTDFGFFAVGYTGASGSGMNDAYIVNFDDSGRIQNQLILGSGGDDDGRFFATNNNKIFIGGSTGSTSGPNRSNMFITALNPDNLTIAWSKKYGGNQGNAMQSFNIDPTDGNIVVGGNTHESTGNGDQGILFKVDSANGAVKWAKSIGATGADYIQGGTILSDGSSVLAGFSNSFGGTGNNVILIKTTDGDLCTNSSSFTLAADDYADSLVGPSVPDHVDSLVAFVVHDYNFTTNSTTTTTNSLCSITSVRTISIKDNTIQIYPNPTSGLLTIEAANGWNSKVTMTVFNLIGSEVIRQTIEPQTKVTTLDLSSSPKGMYIISFNDGKTITTEKVNIN